MYPVAHHTLTETKRAHIYCTYREGILLRSGLQCNGLHGSMWADRVDKTMAKPDGRSARNAKSPAFMIAGGPQGAIADRGRPDSACYEVLGGVGDGVAAHISSQPRHRPRAASRSVTGRRSRHSESIGIETCSISASSVSPIHSPQAQHRRS